MSEDTHRQPETKTGTVSLNTTPREVSGCTQTVFLLVPVGIMALGAAVIFMALYWWHDYQSSADWPTTSGTITRAEVESVRGKTIIIGNDDDAGDPQYCPHLVYSYTVNGRAYTNDDLYFSVQALLDFDTNYDTRARAERYLDGYRTGQRVTVIYHPDDPQQAILERRIDELYVYAAIGGGMVGAAIGLAALVSGVLRIVRG
ncbi:MAG: DUF3592 domain-containing protein [Anaerolineae bacterium]|nr:DUF3592 domain-containing protein [Anaerolineae bacterium]